jgi:hypothetical protein
MSEKATCGNCRYMGVIMNADKAIATVCRRYPPQIFAGPRVAANGQLAGTWTVTALPAVERTETCGEHSPRLDS